MSEKPVAYVDAHVLQGLGLLSERGGMQCWLTRKPENDNLTPLYSQSPAEVRALAIAEAIRACENIGKDIVCPEECAEAIRALSSPPSVSEEWIRNVIKLDHTLATMRDCEQRDIAVRATLAALGVEVK